MQNKDPILECIEESDIPFEMQLLKDPTNKDIWKQYFEHRQQHLDQQAEEGKRLSCMKNTLAMLSRQYRQFPDDYGYWTKFVNYYLEFLKLDKTDKNEINSIIQIFATSIETHGSKPSFWIKYLTILISYQELISTEFILDLFNVALLKLKQNEHHPLWILLFNDYILNDSKISPRSKFDIYSSFFVYLKNSDKFNIHDEESDPENEKRIPNYDDIFSILIQIMNNWEQIMKFDSIFNEFVNPKFLLKLSDSELELYRRYLDKLIKLSNDKKIDENKLKGKIIELFETIVKKFPDQQSIFTIKYAKYLIQIDQFDDSVKTLETYLYSSLTVKDFTMIFDGLTEILEKKVNELSESAGEEMEITKYLDKLESLLSNRLILLNDVKLRQNTNSPATWIERLDIMKENDEDFNKILECYSKAVLSIDTKKIPRDEKLLLPQIWCDYAKAYSGKGDIITARTLYETSTKVPWTEMDQLEYIWIDWVKLEIELGNVEHATFVCSKAVSIPDQISSGKVDIEDESISVQMKLFKSIRLWSLYLDLVENTKTFDEVCKAYENAMELKVINGVLIINYCLYLEEAGYIEKSFSVFERGLNMFNGESRSILYCIYLNKILQYWDKLEWDIERVREIFENGLEYYTDDVNDDKNLKRVYVLYSEWEVKYGSKIRSAKILREGIDRIKKQVDKLLLYKILIFNTIENKGLEWVVEIFQEALENISVQIPGYINDLVCGFVEVEVTLGHVSRGREILQYAVENIMEFGKSNDDKNSIWDLFKAFELENGDETTYKEMLRRRRYLENVYGSVAVALTESVPEDVQESKNAQIRKELQDRIGFVVSSSGPKTTTFTMGVDEPVKAYTLSKNDDAIDLEMDMDDDE